MIRANRPAAAVHHFTSAGPTRPSARTAEPKKTGAIGWSPTSNPALARDLRERLSSQAGRELFAELLENQLNPPDAEQGFRWDADELRSMQWTLRASELGDDSVRAAVVGRELTLESEGSGLVGKAAIGGSTREELSAAIAEAVADLDARIAAARKE